MLGAESEHTPLNPASNAKVLTAAVVLDRMGPDYRFTTGLYGKPKDGVVSPLVLRGNGDPSLEEDELWQLASSLRQQGIRKVDGVLVDQSYFDGEFLAPGFAQQPNEWAPFRAPVSAVALERNAVTLNVVPAKAGAPATVWVDPPGFVDLVGTVGTRAASPGNGVRFSLVPKDGRLRGELGGFIGDGAPRLRFGKRVDDPRSFPGYVLSEVLRRMGIEVTGPVGLGGDGVTARLAYVESAPLGVLVRELGKNSDNFYAEMLLKALGAFTKGAPGKSGDGADAVLAWVIEGGQAPEPGTRFVNGSGLFDTNRVSAWTMASALRRAYRSPRVGPDFIAQLSVGGVDGTLRARFKAHATDHVIRAKTGTLDHVIALAGYVLPPAGKHAVAFSIIVESKLAPHEVRGKIDDVVEAIAKELWTR